jgi:hypothetical protein
MTNGSAASFEAVALDVIDMSGQRRLVLCAGG